MQEEAKNVPFEEEWLIGPGGHYFYTRVWSAQEARAVVLFVHGFMEHVGRYDLVFPIWTARGITVFAFDQRGFGRTCFGDRASTDALYGKTSGVDQVRDIEFFLTEAFRRYPDKPIFLMGFSMGGGRVLHFVTRTSGFPAPESVGRISGVIAYAPHVREARPTSKWVRRAGAVVKAIAPYKNFHTGAKPEHFSHDPVTNKDWADDPMIKAQGTLQLLGDLLNDGEELTKKGFQHWPKDLPVLFLHGTEDPVTCPIASKEFYDKLPANKKAYHSFPGAFHELHNEPTDKDRFNEVCIGWIEDHIIEVQS